MKITKKQIEFFKSYISKDNLRPVLKCLFLDLDTVREENINNRVTRYAKLVATDGFVLGSIEVELTEADKNSFFFPYEHLEVSKHYLKRAFEWVQVEKVNDEIFYRTFSATIQIADTLDGEYPDYKKATSNKKVTEYVVKVNAKLLKDVAESHIRLGQKEVCVQMTGSREPIFFKNYDENIGSLLMPITIEDKEKGELQK